MRHNRIDQDASPSLATASANAGAATVITIAAVTDQFWVLDWIAWSYATTPTAGGITVTIGGVLVFDLSIPAAGDGFIAFDGPLYRELAGKAMVITLADGNAVGKLNIRYR